MKRWCGHRRLEGRRPAQVLGDDGGDEDARCLAVQDERACILGSAVRVAPPAEPQRLALVSVQVDELLRPGAQPAADYLPALRSPLSATRPAAAYNVFSTSGC